MSFSPIKTAVFDTWSSRTLLAITLLLGCAVASGEDFKSPNQVEYRNDKLNIRLTYSTELVPVPSGRTEAPLSLVNRSGGYPTFNIVALPGNLALSARSNPSPVDQVLEGYKRLGLNDAKITQSQYHDLLNETGLTLEIEYSDKGQQLISSITVANGIDCHFFFTFIAPKAQFESARNLGRDIIQSIQFINPPSRSSLDNQPTTDFGWLPYCLLGMVVLIALIIRYLKASFRSKS